ncbi:MAG: SAM-dependent methyltransferase, partial [Oscillospiraceae bacterium]|nr:SAM-dependent methyltransferase [Oscillospiraceae bacterium]
VLRPGGVLLAGFANGISFLFEGRHPLKAVNKLPFNPLRMSEKKRRRMEMNFEGYQFSHTMEEQVGGQCKAGFVLTGLYEDRDRPGEAPAISEYIPLYAATRAVKP